MRRDDRGVSLFELMVVVAMIGVLMGVGIVGINSMLGRPAQECAQKVAYSLEKHRTTAMSKIKASYTLKLDDNDLYLVEEVDNNTGQIGQTTTKLGSAMNVRYYESSAGGTPTEVTMRNGDTLKLQFDRGTGSFKYLEGTTKYCVQIRISRAGRVCDIFLEPITGKVYLN